MKQIQIQKHKNILPTEEDCSFKYTCPNCSNTHWLYAREVKIKNFKIACECGSVLIPKNISGIKAIYKDSTDTLEYVATKPQKQKEQKEVIVPPPVPPLDIRKECATILGTFGYSVVEINNVLEKAIESIKCDYIKEVVNYSLKNLGDTNV